jgi:S-adenosylmethionine:tRNA ribosyltransferase-isomerase
MLYQASIPIHNYQYELPESRIAKYPLSDRSASRLLIYEKGTISHTVFKRLPEHLPPGSSLVFNNTRVIQARLYFQKDTGARIEIFCLEPSDPADYERAFQAERETTWYCLVGNVKKWKSGPVFLNIPIAGKTVKLEARLKKRSGEGFLVHFQWTGTGISFGALLEESGSTPIPPYLKREAEESDRERYQTVYGLNKGSVAAPTAGLHFTGEMIEQMEQSGVPMYHLTLHVGAGTFVPVKEENAREHPMHRELVVVARSFLELLKKRNGGMVAVGTTSTRSLESLYWLGIKLRQRPETDPEALNLAQWENEQLQQDIPLNESISALLDYCSRHQLEHLHFSTRLMIVPGYRFRTISGLITNFHMPGSTLLLLIAAWIGEDWRRVYAHALGEDFRFLSYGDSSLLIP